MTDQEMNEAIAKRLGWYQDKIVQPGWELKPGEKPWEHMVWFKPNGSDKPSGIWGSDLPDYVHDMQAAWNIVSQHNGAFQLTRDGQYPIWQAWFGGDKFTEETAMLAICKAFLKLEGR